MAIRITSLTFAPSGGNPNVGTFTASGTVTPGSTVQVQLRGGPQAAGVNGGNWSREFVGENRTPPVHVIARATLPDGTKRKCTVRITPA